MTMPDERTRAVLWAGGFLIELAHDESVPMKRRRQAVAIARHYVTRSDLALLHMALSSSIYGSYFAHPNEVYDKRDFPFGTLNTFTRLRWPEEAARPEETKTPEEGDDHDDA